MSTLEQLKAKYPGAQAWQIGDSPALADELATLVASGIKTASCGSFACWQAEDPAPKLGSYNIILNGRDEPVCVIRIISLRLTRFCDVTEAFARKEGEGDLSLEYWRKEHQRFFSAAGIFSEEMELVAEEFEVVERV
ncbi:ASCH domain-containing protein [Kosakonia cowanii]|uniref:ASCH domain-containing protein n=1 Tax=Kosakonia cowanii JCM 10956 = DSM 18146 TaxID=1300165 RepID=A0A830ZEF5_9ENTR|nr:ASCH domain-containing protein [Kosakonia cowanii]APZ07419.1 ASCH domain-containing protein [Kosakonia cowanii JCM 10956 = DSM 18146]MDM9615057.1 ASCH domain-containing protein [Kosakonia cowanii]MDP4560472.1 ASCH domain-containing protein [Kosakonia cowanii]WRY61768.1 ASCH domain-containing protein [Kosakonia cowanii]